MDWTSSMNEAIIELPADLDPDRRARLEAKLEEYKARREESANTPPEHDQDTVFKIAILSAVLAEGHVDTCRMYRSFQERFGASAKSAAFNVACGVIDDYIKTGGQMVSFASQPFEQIPIKQR